MILDICTICTKQCKKEEITKCKDYIPSRCAKCRKKCKGIYDPELNTCGDFLPINTTSQETDPHGKNPHESGAKCDQGKVRLGLIVLDFPQALEAVGVVSTLGAKKYTDHGWASVPNGEARYTDAMLRHLFKEAQGEIHDPDLGTRHAAQVAWNALARLELQLREKHQ